jgi:uncharacterized protein (TIGR03118 family)
MEIASMVRFARWKGVHMRHGTLATILSLSTVLIVGHASPAVAQYIQHNLVSDGAVPAPVTDTALVNPWGLAASSTSPWWVSDNGTGKSTLYNGNTGAKVPLTVNVPGSPTGIVFNAGSGFVIPAHGVARFLFASEDGTISGWSGGTNAFVVVDSSASGAVYKGLAIAHTIAGDFIYAANFHAATVDVFDSTFTPVPGGFKDPTIPPGYAPFGIQNLSGTIYVAYALQDAAKHDDVSGPGHGYVNAFDMAGNLLRRVASRGALNSPWGLALAPASFGRAGGELLSSATSATAVSTRTIRAWMSMANSATAGRCDRPRGAPSGSPVCGRWHSGMRGRPIRYFLRPDHSTSSMASSAR